MMRKTPAASVETLERRQHLSSAGYTEKQPVRVIGPTEGVTAAATPTITGITNLVLGDRKEGADALANVDLDTTVIFKIELPNGVGVRDSSLNRTTTSNSFNGRAIKIVRVSNGQAIETEAVKTSGGGDTILIKPKNLLLANTQYRVEVNTGADSTQYATDISNEAFAAFTQTFTTGTYRAEGDRNIRFDPSIQVTKATNGAFTSVTIGPDNRLYAGTLQGYIYRYDIDPATGALSNEEQLNFVRANNGNANRFITGITFDPRSNPNEPVLWISHGQYAFGDTTGTYAVNHTGKISRVWGQNFSNYQDVIINIPRSAKDHLNNQISFDPIAKNLYFVIPSMSAMGQPDGVWGNRAEELSTAAILRLQLRSKGTRIGVEEWIRDNGPINLDPNAAQPYNLYRGVNPLRLYATGIRNAFDMVFHSNGKLYMPANSSAAGGNAPATPSNLANVPNSYRLDYNGTNPYTGPVVAQQNNIDQVVDDFLFDVVEGGYYGHPNPTRGEYVLNNGNVPGSRNLATIYDYPAGVQPDRNYRGYAYGFGKNVSPNGVIEYKSNAFGGRLKGQLLVARYASGSDVVALKPNADGTFDANNAATLGIAGLTQLEAPLDIVEDTRNGNLYTVSLINRNGSGRITLSRPIGVGLTPSTSRLKIYSTAGDTNGSTQTVTFTNTTNGSVFIDPKLIRMTGKDRSSFVITNFPTSELIVRSGQSVPFNIKYVARAGETGIRAANIAIPLGDAAGTYVPVQVRGTALTPTASIKAAAAAKPIGDTGGAKASAVVASITQRQMYFNAVKGTSDTQILRITNTGDRNLVLVPGSVTVLGGDRRNYALPNMPAEGVVIRPGRRFDLQVTFTPRAADTFTPKVARVRIITNDPANPAFSVTLRGLPTAGIGDDKEPSLQRVLDTFGLPINVGDTNPDDYLLGTPSSDSNEVTVQSLVRADSRQAVTIRPLAVFGTDNGPTVRVGIYTPGDAESQKLLWYVPRESAQSLNPIAYGQTTINPGDQPFGLVGQFPGFFNENGTDRLVYSEDQLNAIWEPNASARRKVRFYPYVDQNGTAVPNAYIVAMEEYTANYDQQDVVFVITNVKPAAGKPTLAVQSQYGLPNNDRLAFNKVENSDPLYPNTTRTDNILQVRNTGTQNLTVSFGVSGNYSIVSGGGTNVTIAPGATRNVRVRFTATSGTVHNGTLTITSNDPANPSKTIALAGYWQEYSEFPPGRPDLTLEPNVRTIVQDVFGYKTVFTNAGQNLNNNGRIEAVGDEVISAYWRAADDSAQVRVTQLAAFHNQTYEDNGQDLPTATFLQWYRKGSPAQRTTFLTHAKGDSQSVLPRDGASGQSGNIASSAFDPGDATFGFVVENNEYSDPVINQGNVPGNEGHFVRFFPAKDANGLVIPNAYIMLHDYNRAFTNYDFNDNIWLVENIVPENAIKSPLTVFTEETSRGARIAFTSPATGPKIYGFNVYRSLSPDSGFVRINDVRLDRRPVTVFIDETSTTADTYYYRITSVGAGGRESAPVTVRQ